MILNITTENSKMPMFWSKEKVRKKSKFRQTIKDIFKRDTAIIAENSFEASMCKYRFSMGDASVQTTAKNNDTLLKFKDNLSVMRKAKPFYETYKKQKKVSLFASVFKLSHIFHPIDSSIIGAEEFAKEKTLQVDYNGDTISVENLADKLIHEKDVYNSLSDNIINTIKELKDNFSKISGLEPKDIAPETLKNLGQLQEKIKQAQERLLNYSKKTGGWLEHSIYTEEARGNLTIEMGKTQSIREQLQRYDINPKKTAKQKFEKALTSSRTRNYDSNYSTAIQKQKDNSIDDHSLDSNEAIEKDDYQKYSS